MIQPQTDASNISGESCRYGQYSSGPQILQKFRRHLQILGTGRVTFGKVHIEYLHLWSDL